MNTLEAENILVKHLLTEWDGSVYHTIPIVLENQNSTAVIDASDSWVRFVVRENNSKQRSLGEKGYRKFLRYGFIIFQVHVRPDDATYTGKSICEFIRTIFEGEDINNVICEDCTYSGNGVIDGWYQFVGYITYEFEQNK